MYPAGHGSGHYVDPEADREVLDEYNPMIQ
jgi:hypothetical protein